MHVGGLRKALGGGCATMRDRSERVESPGTYVTEGLTQLFLLIAVFFFIGPPSRALVVITWRA